MIIFFWLILQYVERCFELKSNQCAKRVVPATDYDLLKRNQILSKSKSNELQE